MRTEPETDAGQMPDTPGWYPDPGNPDALKHWNGTEWSDSLFDDVTSVAVVESRDPVLFLDDVDPPARVAMPNSPPIVEEPAEEIAEEITEEEVAEEITAEVAEEITEDAEPKETWDVPKRSPLIRTVIVAASIVALAAIGVLIWQLVGDDGEGASEAVVTDDETTDAETAEAADADAAPPEAEATTLPSPEPIEASPSSAGEAADDPADDPAAADEGASDDGDAPAAEEPEPGLPLLASHEVNLIPEAATIRSKPRLDSDDVGLVEQSQTAELVAVGEPIDGWRAIDGTGGWIWGAFVAPAAADQIVARTLNGAPAILRDEAGIPTGNPSLAGAHVLIVDGGQPLWKVVLPEGGFAYVQDVEFELVLS